MYTKLNRYLSETCKKRTFQDTLEILKDTVEVQEQGHAVDKEYPDILYVPGVSICSFVLVKQVS